MQFKLVRGGRHTIGDKTYRVGDIIETDVELDKKFAALKKFERVVHSPGNGGEEAPDESPPSAYGSDVTALVNSAMPKGTLRVYQKGPWYTVVDTANGQVLNEKSLRRNQVRAFLDNIVQEAEDIVQKLQAEALQEV